MRVCYRAPNGDYLCIKTLPRAVYVDMWSEDDYQVKGIREGRATAITGQPSSICATGIAVAYLRDCYRVPYAKVPPEYAERF